MDSIRDKILEILRNIGRSEEWLLEFLLRHAAKLDKRKEYAKEYYNQNKKRLDAYHKQYMNENPEYRNKAKQRTKDAKRKR